MFSPLFARLLRLSVFAMLLTSALVAIVASERMWHLWRPGELPKWAPLAAPLCFVLLLLVFALDRFVAVQRQQEVLPRALMQVGAAVFLLSLLLPQEVVELRRAWHLRRSSVLTRGAQAAGSDAMPTDVLLHHPDPRVRQSACLLLAWSAWVPPAAEEADAADEQNDLGEPSNAIVLIDLYREVSLLSDSDVSADVRLACGLARQRLQEDLEGLEPDGEHPRTCPGLQGTDPRQPTEGPTIGPPPGLDPEGDCDRLHGGEDLGDDATDFL